jgi:hypothetical protein
LQTKIIIPNRRNDSEVQLLFDLIKKKAIGNSVKKTILKETLKTIFKFKDKTVDQFEKMIIRFVMLKVILITSLSINFLIIVLIIIGSIYYVRN